MLDVRERSRVHGPWRTLGAPKKHSTDEALARRSRDLRMNAASTIVEAVEDGGSVQRLVDELRRDVDGALIDARLLLTPTERVERMRDCLQFIEDLRAARANTVQADR